MKEQSRFTKPKVAAVAITKGGAKILSRLGPLLPEADLVVAERFADYLGKVPNKVIAYQGGVKDKIGGFIAAYDQLIFCVSLGAVIRLAAPYLKSKEEDPGLLVIDDAAKFVISVLSGHLGGANAFTEKVAALLGATPVITTASDASKTLPVDILGRELGWQVQARKQTLIKVSAHVVNEEPIALIQESGSKNWWKQDSPIPKNIQLFSNRDEVDYSQFEGILLITLKKIDPSWADSLAEKLVVYRPPEGQI